MKIENWQRKPFKRSLKWDASCYEWFCKRTVCRPAVVVFKGSNYNWKRVIKQKLLEKQRIDYYSNVSYNRNISLFIIKSYRIKSYLARKKLKKLLTEDKL